MPEDKNIPSIPDRGQSIEKGQNSMPDFQFTPPPPPLPPPPPPPPPAPTSTDNNSGS